MRITYRGPVNGVSIEGRRRERLPELFVDRGIAVDSGPAHMIAIHQVHGAPVAELRHQEPQHIVEDRARVGRLGEQDADARGGGPADFRGAAAPPRARQSGDSRCGTERHGDEQAEEACAIISRGGRRPRGEFHL